MWKRLGAAGRVFSALRSGVPAREIVTGIMGISSRRADGQELADEEIAASLRYFMTQLVFVPHEGRSCISDIHEVVELLSRSTRIVVIIGAGASIGPDFRSPGGLYDMIAASGALEDPYQVFDLEYFLRDPTVFWRFAHMIFPAVKPKHSETHWFISRLQSRGKLLRLYSQNVDTLEVGVPDDKMRCVHGSWRANKCVSCGEVHGIDDLRPSVERQSIPVCKRCQGPIKPGIVFFGQRTNIHDQDVENDSQNADLLVVIGTSLRVAPVSYLPDAMQNVPAILINREPVTCSFNAELLGDCDEVCASLQGELGWRAVARPIDDFVFVPPNRFVLAADGTATRFVETARSLFFVTPVAEDHSAFD